MKKKQQTKTSNKNKHESSEFEFSYKLGKEGYFKTKKSSTNKSFLGSFLVQSFVTIICIVVKRLF